MSIWKPLQIPITSLSAVANLSISSPMLLRILLAMALPDPVSSP